MESRHPNSLPVAGAPLPMLLAPSLHIATSVPLRDIKQRHRTSSLEFLDGEESVAKHLGENYSGLRVGSVPQGREADAGGDEPRTTQIKLGQHSTDINLSPPLESILDPSISSYLQENAVVEVRLNAC